MRVLTINEIKEKMDLVYSKGEQSKNARDELLQYGEQLLAANEFEAYQTLLKQCVGIISDKGIDINPTERAVVDGKAVEVYVGENPIMDFAEKMAQQTKMLDGKTEYPEEVRQTRETLEHTVLVLVNKEKITDKVRKDPASIKAFVAAIDKNNDLTKAAVAIEEKRLQHFKEYFPDTDAKTTINPNADTYKDSTYDQAQRADMQIQLLKDLKKVVDELDKNEENRKKFQRQVDEGDEDARANVEACKRKELELKQKIAKESDGRETGLMQRLNDFELKSEHVSKLDIDRMEEYAIKASRIESVITTVEAERLEVYKEMARDVMATLEEKGVVDAKSKYAGKKDALIAACKKILGDSGKDKKSGEEYREFGEEEDIVSKDAIEKNISELKGYVKYVKDEISLSQDKINEANDAIEFRNETKEMLEAEKTKSEGLKRKAEELKTTPVTEEQKNDWLNETITVGEGENTRTVSKKELIEEDAKRKARKELGNKGKGFFTKVWDNVKFAFTHGFRSRDKLIAERAESLITENEDRYVSEKRREQIRKVEEESKDFDRLVNKIETISRETRNDASIHTAAHNAAANITDAIGRTSGSGRDTKREREYEQTAKNLSNMGYDMALQQWRNGELSQAEFDRILKEHLDTTRAQKDRYAAPDETKGYTKTPEYRNKEAEPAPAPAPAPEPAPEEPEHEER